METNERAKILVVDDLPEKLLVYQAILAELGQELVLVRSGEEALGRVLNDEFAVILLDVNMPGLGGFETANMIRRRKKSSHTPIIFVTAFNDELRAAEGYAHGAVDFISTPIVPAILRAKVRVFVDLFRMTQQVRRQAEQQIALATERSQRAAAEEANRRLSFLVKAGGIITRSLDQRVTIENILRLLVSEQADRVGLALYERGEWKTVLAEPGASEAQLHDVAGLDELPTDWRPAIEQAAGVPEAGAAPVEPGANFLLPWLVALPLRDREHTFGVLTVARERNALPFTPADIQMLESIASRSAIALIKARLYEEIEFANQQKNRFLSMLAHELRNPLAPIQSAVDLMRLSKIEDGDLGWARDVIGRQVTHLARLVDDLLDVSRITLGKIRLNLELIDATQIVPAAVEISRPLIEEGGHQLAVTVPPQPLMIIGDRARLTQVLSNLLNNAAKYTPRGGSISLGLDESAGEAVFRVRDSGIGIPAPMLARVFDLFTQLDNSIDRSQGGLGIGLTLVRELVELHGGRVEAASAGANQGCEFSVRIPKSRAGAFQSGAQEVSPLDASNSASTVEGCSPAI
jgi:signal transduction histidine kinase/FixJ family two-component response regulator